MVIRLRATDRHSLTMEQRRYDDCGMDGDDKETVTIGGLNRLMRRIAIVHLQPTETAAEQMRLHVEECAKLQAKIAGGIFVLQWLMGGCITVGIALLVAWLKNGLGI